MADSAHLLEEELRTFSEHRDELVAAAEGQFALIHDGNVIGTYSDQMDAIREGYRRFGNVPFLVAPIVSTDVPANFVNNNVGI